MPFRIELLVKARVVKTLSRADEELVVDVLVVVVVVVVGSGVTLEAG